MKLSTASIRLFRKALDKWGADAQIEMLKEECIDLALALQKLKRSGDYDQKVAAIIDEIADVTIMLAQVDLLFDMDAINERIEFKLYRLDKRVNDEK